MTQIEPSAAPTNQRGNRGSGLTLNALLLLSNAVFFVFSALAIAASITVFLLTRANDRQKDRELDRYKAEAAVQVANAHATAEKAKADAAAARAEAEQAHLATAEIARGLGATRKTLNDAQSHRVLAEAQTLALVEQLKSFRPTGTFLVAAAATPEAQSYGYQLLGAFQVAGVPMPAGVTLQQNFRDSSDKGTLQVEYGSGLQPKDARTLLRILKNVGVHAILHKFTPAEETVNPQNRGNLCLCVYPIPSPKF
jgi:hypothetical protein